MTTITGIVTFILFVAHNYCVIAERRRQTNGLLVTMGLGKAMNAKLRDGSEENTVQANRAVLWACLWVVAAGLVSIYSPRTPQADGRSGGYKGGATVIESMDRSDATGATDVR